MADLPHLIRLGQHADTGKPMGWDYDKEPNLGIFGGAGMGKTTLMDNAMEQIAADVAWYKQQGRRSGIIIFDPKGGLGYRRWGKVAKIISSDWDLSDGFTVWRDLFRYLRKEYDHRMDMIKAVSDRGFAADPDGPTIDEWKAGGIGPLFVVLEEIQALFTVMESDVRQDANGEPVLDKDGQEKIIGPARIKACQGQLMTAASLYRASGIRLITISQAAHDCFIPTKAKLSIPAKICMGTTIAEGQYMAAFGESMPGDFLYLGGRGRGIALLNGYTDPIVMDKPRGTK